MKHDARSLGIDAGLPVAPAPRAATPALRDVAAWRGPCDERLRPAPARGD